MDSTPMRPFTPASYGYDAGVTPAAPAETKPVVAENPVVIAQSAAAVSYGVDPSTVVGGSIQPIAATPRLLRLKRSPTKRLLLRSLLHPLNPSGRDNTQGMCS